MANFYDKTCEIYNLWHAGIRPNVGKEISFIFEDRIDTLKQYHQTKNYKSAIPIIHNLIGGFNPDNYKGKSWESQAVNVLRKLEKLEKIAKGLAK